MPEAPIGELNAFGEQVDLMFDLIALAYQADLTRVASYIMVAEGTNRTYNHIGVSDSFHPVSHHANDLGRLEKLAKIQTWQGGGVDFSFSRQNSSTSSVSSSMTLRHLDGERLRVVLGIVDGELEFERPVVRPAIRSVIFATSLIGLPPMSIHRSSRKPVVWTTSVSPSHRAVE